LASGVGDLEEGRGFGRAEISSRPGLRKNSNRGDRVVEGSPEGRTDQTDDGRKLLIGVYWGSVSAK